MRRYLALALLAAALCGSISVNAQTTCGGPVVQGQTWTAAQWNTFFACVQAKTDGSPATLSIGSGSPITSSGPGGALGSNAFSSTAYLPLTGGTVSGAISGQSYNSNNSNVTVGAGSLVLSSSGSIYWNADSGFVRDSIAGAGNIDCGNGNTNDKSCTLSLANLIASASVKNFALIETGSVPTTTGSTCASIGTPTGGNTAGTVVVTCTSATLVFNFATTAPHGWNCDAHDWTTPADSMNQTASTTTSCTLVGTTAASDTVGYHAVGF